METGMFKNLVAIAAACAVLSLATLAAHQALAGNGAQGTPAKFKSNSHAAITEFSSSSARTSGPHR